MTQYITSRDGEVLCKVDIVSDKYIQCDTCGAVPLSDKELHQGAHAHLPRAMRVNIYSEHGVERIVPIAESFYSPVFKDYKEQW